MYSFFWGESPVSEFYVPTFWNTVLGAVNRRITWKPNNPVILPAYTNYEDGTDRVFQNIAT